METKYSKVRLVIGFVLAALMTFTLASIFHSQFVLAGLNAIDIDISLQTRLSFTWSDWLGFLPAFFPVISLSLLLGFSIMAVIRKWWSPDTRWMFAVAGGLAMATMLIAMQPLLNITLIAGARSVGGFTCQVLAGVIGGFWFSRLLNWASHHKPA